MRSVATETPFYTLEKQSDNFLDVPSSQRSQTENIRPWTVALIMTAVPLIKVKYYIQK